MPNIDRNELRNRLRRREIDPVYVLFGAETYLRDIAARTIADFSFGEADFRDFNDAEFSLGSGGSIASALAAAEQLPMMAQRRVISIGGVRVSNSSAKDTLKEDDESILAAFLSRPPISSVVIFIADELNGVRKMGRLLREKAVAVEFKKLDSGELLQWAAGKVKECGSEIDDRSLKYLTAMTGPDLRRLVNEIEKVSTAALPDRVITTELIDSLVPNSSEQSNFDLADHLLAGDRQKALQTLQKILSDGAEPVMLLGLLSFSFRRLLIVKEMMARNVPRADVAKVLKVIYSAQERLLADARRADAGHLADILKRIARCDLDLKTSVAGGGNAGSKMLLELLVCEILAD
ncbi:MAG: DNA polymerase III subunit delta [Acidobacteriota bacterium]